MKTIRRTLGIVAGLATATAGTAHAQGGQNRPDLPLEGTRHAAFTTNEGTWMSLDVSPDGETIVFDLLGDLYTMPMTGGPATRLTSGMGFDGQPRFSPDGTKIVFTSDRDGGENVWVMAVDGSDTTQVTRGRSNSYLSPEWTPDGEYIVASRGGNSKLWMYHAKGGSGAQLVSQPGNLKMVGAAFGPDGRYIWYAQRFNNWRYNATFPQYQLAVYDRETGNRYPRSSRYGSAFRPTVSPDGRWLVYGTRHDRDTGLRIRDLHTGDEEWLAYPVQRDDQESPATRDVLPGMAFTPDSRSLIASYGGKIWNIPVDGTEPLQIPFEAAVELDLGPILDFDYDIPDDSAFVAKQIRDPVPSPDGDRIAFVAMDRLYVMAYPDGEPRRVTTDDLAEHHPAWSPDGQWLGYVTWSETDGGHIRKVSVAGGPSQPLTPAAGFYTQPAWSPDGSRMVSVRTPARNFRDAIARGGSSAGADLVWVGADGGPVTAIAPVAGVQRPHFTADPDRIYASSFGGRLVSMRWDGTDRKEHVIVRGAGGGGPISASLVMMAPVGDQALAQVVNDLYVVTVPILGGETPSISVANPTNAAFPARRLTEIGGQFPTWESGGRRIHWALGNAHFVFDLDSAEAEDDEEPADSTVTDSTAANSSSSDSTAADSSATREGDDDDEDEGYKPSESRIEIDVTRDIPRGVVVLRGATAITMLGTQIIPNADIVVTDNRITAIGRQGSVTVPTGAQVLDMSGKTIVPGFVDTHAHLRPMYEIHKTQVWSFLANLAYGVTTTRDPQTATTDVLSYEDMVTAGRILGPRIYSTGPGVFGSENVSNLEHAQRVMKRYNEYFDTKTLKMYVAGNRQQRQWIIMAARENNIMPTTEGALNAKLNLTNTIDGYPGMEHSLPIYPIYKDVIELFAHTRRVYTPTLLVSYGGPWAENYFYATEEVHDNMKLRRFTPHQEIDQKSLRRGGAPGQAGWFRDEQHIFSRHAEFVRDLVRAGGRAGVGSHGQLQGLGYHWELWALQSGGLSEHDALRVATLHGAEAIGLEKEIGSIQVGKLADMIVLNSNPLDNIRNTNDIGFVMMNGRLYEGDTLNEVWPRQRPLDGIQWWNDAPNTTAGIRQP